MNNNILRSSKKEIDVLIFNLECMLEYECMMCVDELYRYYF